MEGFRAFGDQIAGGAIGDFYGHGFLDDVWQWAKHLIQGGRDDAPGVWGLEKISKQVQDLYLDMWFCISSEPKAMPLLKFKKPWTVELMVRV